MLAGYFEDLHLVLAECRRVMRPGSKAAFVVGNARYCGHSIEVDRLLSELGAVCGLRHERTVALRTRGNSAQQMGRFGRRPSRESVVIFRRV
jgi:hypothetical protein